MRRRRFGSTDFGVVVRAVGFGEISDSSDGELKTELEEVDTIAVETAKHRTFRTSNWYLNNINEFIFEIDRLVEFWNYSEEVIIMENKADCVETTTSEDVHTKNRFFTR